jgi:hypothetical protein
MPEPVPLNYQSLQRRAPEPLEEAVEKCVADMFAFSLRGYRELANVAVTRADVSEDLILPAVVIRAARLRESIPTGDVYEVQVAVSVMTLMDRDDDVATNTPAEFNDELWAAAVALVEDPHLLDVLAASRSTVTWHGLTRQGGMEYSRQERHALRTIRFNVHVSRLFVP